MNETYCERCFLANRILCLKKLGFDPKAIYIGLRTKNQQTNDFLLGFCTTSQDRLEHAAIAIGDTSYLTFMRMYSIGMRVVLENQRYDANTAKRDFVLLGRAVEDIELVTLAAKQLREIQTTHGADWKFWSRFQPKPQGM